METARLIHTLILIRIQVGGGGRRLRGHVESEAVTPDSQRGDGRRLIESPSQTLHFQWTEQLGNTDSPGATSASMCT